MTRQRRWTDDDLRKAVSESNTIREVIERLGLSVCAGNYPRMGREIERLGLDRSHMIGSTHRGVSCKHAIPMEKILVSGSSYTSTYHLKKRLLKSGLIKSRCVECGQAPEWNGKPLMMILDHINGVRNDHRLTNLRMLCPNCNSQQDTFAGRNRGK
jgi:hypothetical protein